MTTATAPGGPILVDERMGSLSINGVNLCTVAWCVQDLKPLWEEDDYRGGTKIVPEQPGELSYPLRRGKRRVDLDLTISGFVDTAGHFYSNPFTGLEAHVDYLNANVVAPVGTGAGTRGAVLTKPTGATRTANVRVLGMPFKGQVGPIVVATLKLEIPLGRFA